jgi:hypothetical protein
MAIDDDGGRQVMAIPYLTLTLWVRWANKVLTDITLISTSWRKRFSYNRSKQSRWLSWRYYLIDITEFCLKYSSILSSSHKDGGWAGPHKWNNLRPVFILSSSHKDGGWAGPHKWNNLGPLFILSSSHKDGGWAGPHKWNNLGPLFILSSSHKDGGWAGPHKWNNLGLLFI